MVRSAGGLVRLQWIACVWVTANESWVSQPTLETVLGLDRTSGIESMGHDRIRVGKDPTSSSPSGYNTEIRKYRNPGYLSGFFVTAYGGLVSLFIGLPSLPMTFPVDTEYC